MRAFAWVLMLGTASVSIVAGIVLSSLNVGQSLMVASGQLGPAGNWVLCFLSVSIGFSVFVLRGVDGGVWTISAVGVTAVLGVSVGLFLFGIYGLLALGMVSAVSAPILIRRQRPGKGRGSA